MSSIKILFEENGHAITADKISQSIVEFGDSYNDATKEIIKGSMVLDKNGAVFVKCASRILSSFGMTRSGPFHVNAKGKLHDCWDAIGTDLIEINSSVRKSGLSRDRYLLELSESERKELVAEIWIITKKLLPFTMGKTAFGLVGASKILFSVLPEIALPIDNAQWLHVFKTVDIGDVINRMVFDIQQWESMTERQLNNLDNSKRLTTIPSVYNVMAMYARPKNNDTKIFSNNRHKELKELKMNTNSQISTSTLGKLEKADIREYKAGLI